MTAQKARTADKTRTARQPGTTQPARTAARPRADRVGLATAIRDAVLAVDGVAGLATGGPVEVATLYAGGKIPGVRLGDELVEVHVRVEAVPMMPLAERIHAAVRGVLEQAGAEQPVEVVVDDVDLAALAASSGR